MANILKIKRGTLATIPTLADGELGGCTDAPGKVYWGYGGTNRLIGDGVFLPFSGGTLTGALTLHADPSSALHAATKQYVDGLIQGIDAKASVKAATTANITLSGTQTIDGIALSVGDRVLVKDQSPNTYENGVYVVAAGAWSRASDADSWAELPALYTWVEQGTANGDSGWLCTVDAGGTLGSTAVTFTQFSGAGSITAGDGLTKTGSTINVVGTSNRITVSADAVDIASTYAGQATITTLGTVATGTWNATAIAANKGGTGQTSYAVGDLLYASASDAISKLADIATGNVLLSGGVGAAPSYGKVGLTTHISGTLGAANGGTGVANNAANTITFSGNYGLTLTLSNTTSLTLPTSGTLATTSQLHTQNTDTYTTSGTFKLNGASGPFISYWSTVGIMVRKTDDTPGDIAARYGWFSAGSAANDTPAVDLANRGALGFYDASNTNRSKLQHASTAARTWTLPDETGTLLSSVSTIDGGTW